MAGAPIWSHIVDAASDLTRRGSTPFALDILVRQVQRRNPQIEASSIPPVVQGMTVNAPGGVKSACGEVLYRVDRGMYELLSGDPPAALPRTDHYEAVVDVDAEIDGIGDPVGFLKVALARREALNELDQILGARDVVIDHYGAMFHPDNLVDLTAEGFLGFLRFENNQHWMGIHRHQTAITSDMDLLRSTLALLLDETRPIEDRLDEIVRPGKANVVRGFGKAVFTPILLVVYPDRYGVWNSIAESAMKKLGFWPRFDRGASFGERYRLVNDVMNETADSVGVDLWTLDGLWWAAEQMPELATDDVIPPARLPRTQPPAVSEGQDQRFGLERHLHDFLADNWELTELGSDWELHTEGGDLVGYEYPTDIGRIDLLARHKTDPSWLVIELKRDQSSDRTVGQVTRYMGWVKAHLATEDEDVRGMVISRDAGDQLRYALMAVPKVEFRSYSVEFHLLSDEG